jgi:hypothetical protein
MANYTVFDDGKIVRGDARQILERRRKEAAKGSKEIARMDAEQYAEAMIEDAPYFLPEDLLEALTGQDFDSTYDRALTYLSQMPTSGIRILTVRQTDRRPRKAAK